MSVLQFYLNGFAPSDPQNLYQAHAQGSSTIQNDIPEEVDVLIVGSGPAGLALAAQLSLFPNITTRLVEQKAERLTLGQADGLQVRSIEMFEAYGFSERVLKEAYYINETTFWKPDERNPECIVRSGRIKDTGDDLSEFPHVILNQARVHDFFLDIMLRSSTRLQPSYSRRLKQLVLQQVDDNSPQATSSVQVQLERTDLGHEGQIENVRAKYVVGCDGARSAVRQALGLKLEGDSANQAWGVMDVLAVSDFPDWRTKVAIHSATQGSILIIPREGGYLVRLYIELDKLSANERISSKNISADQLIETAKRIFHPYTLDVKEVIWHSVYEIGQRLCSRFDNLTAEEALSKHPNIFIAGDACHTHSPKAGQGMNVSMQDGFNLAWKLASVLNTTASPAILHTYSLERQKVAQDLINFDREIASMFSARPKTTGGVDDGDGIDPAEFQAFFEKQGLFMAGLGTAYAPSLISAASNHQELAKGFPIGGRLHSAPVIRLADAKPIQLAHIVKADGRWRIFVFASAEDPAVPSSSFQVACKAIAKMVAAFTPAGADVDSVIDVRAILQQGHASLNINDMPAIVWPQKGRLGLRDYEKVFCAEAVVGHKDIFTARQISREKGCVVIVRPDQYVANILPLDDHNGLGKFFAGFMRTRN
ncbi:tetracycline 6-hydroxylase protein [Aureobasidium sp. EXF-3400]|nr:tetracycline 6-hydroxylase protein [Aureobasidium sp. EXF-12344]KAI4772210.1 tetracycline 6-hydroxylase protein [Aureobasidium sp. EXF-3400]